MESLSEDRALDLLMDISALLLTPDLDIETTIDRLTSYAVQLAGADFGAYFYNRGLVEDQTDTWELAALHGANLESFVKLGRPRITELFAPTYTGKQIIRSHDVTNDRLYGQNGPVRGMPLGHLPVRSYLAAPVVLQSGRVQGALLLAHKEPGRFTQRTERLIRNVAAKAALAFGNDALMKAARASEQRMRDFVEYAPRIAWLDDSSGNILYANAAWRSYVGSDALQGLDETTHPDDYERLMAVRAAAIAETKPYELDLRYRRHDGKYRWFSAHVLPLKQADGVVYGWVGMATDIDDMRRTAMELQASRERQKLLIGELNHRVKNTLAIVQSVAHQTSVFNPEPAEFMERFQARLQAVALTHNLLNESDWDSVNLASIVAMEFSPYEHGNRTTVSGPDIQVQASAVVVLGMVFHELTKNAVKYGALSNLVGTVEAHWTVDLSDTGEERLSLSWIERGGPRVSEPSRRGFGTQLLTTITRQLKGSLKMSYRPQGFECEIDIPLVQVTMAD